MQDVSKRYEIEFREIETDNNHVCFFVQSLPKYSLSKIIKGIESITVREIFERYPEAKKKFLGVESFSQMTILRIQLANLEVKRV